MQRIRRLITPNYIVAFSLIAIWALVLTILAAETPMQAASWLTFLALLITPGYLLGDMLTYKLELDTLERLALALPLGITVLAIPGALALLQHQTIHQLATSWALISGLVILMWFLVALLVRGKRPSASKPWHTAEIMLLVLIVIGFIAILPTLNLYKIDGDAFAVNSFAADALSGRPLNLTEPLFGTDLGPGVRMVFNQSLTLNYLWAYFAKISPNDLVAAASKAMLALWAILAAYTLGKAAGKGSRRFGLLTAAIQLLIYMAAPFIRGDNVSLFFFERINADKFMVPVTMLPVVFALAITFVRSGKWQTWLAAAVATFAVSTIHPLIAAMLALAIGAFGAVHLLMNLRRGSAWLRVAALAGLIVIVMTLPFVQLMLSTGEDPLAASYPSSFEDWPIGTKTVPILPFIHMDSLDYYGPMPNMADLHAEDAYKNDNPFLVWRFAINMTRRRLILFDLDSYISDPSLIMEPPYFLAMLLLPFFLWRLKRDEAAQFVVAVSAAVLFVMFNPLITPLIGSFVMPWILWRFVWILPYGLIFALAAQYVMEASVGLVGRLNVSARTTARLTQFAPVLFILLATFALTPNILTNIQNLNGRIAFSYAYPTPQKIFDTLNKEIGTNGTTTVFAEQDLSVTIPAFVADAAIVAHRTPTTSEIFPADQQDLALQRLIDQNYFFTTPYLTSESLDILARYAVAYVIAESGSDLDMQLRMSDDWFTWLVDDAEFSLYAITDTPSASEAIMGNSAMADKAWQTAQTHYQSALEADPENTLALIGMAELAQRQGHFADASNYLQTAIDIHDAPILHYYLGKLLADQGFEDESIAAFEIAQKNAPEIARYHAALGDACINANLEACAEEQYKTAVSLQNWREESGKLIAEADLWRQNGHIARALPLYADAAKINPSEYNIFVLISAYREVGRFDRAAEIASSMRTLYPLSADVVILQADLATAQEKYAEAISLLRHAIWLQELQVQETTDTHLALAEVLIEADQLAAAADEINYAMQLNPFSPTGHILFGDLSQANKDLDASVEAYQRAFELDPSQTGVYVALSNKLRQAGGNPDDVMVLLQTALRVDSQEATLLLALGDQWQRLGDADAAIEAYQGAVAQLTPYGRSANRQRLLGSGSSRAFAYTRIASTYEDLGQTEAAMNYYNSSVAAAPDAAWPHLLLGDALRRRNDVDGAIKAYETAIEHDNQYVDAFVRLADIYEAQGKPERARILYDRVMQLTAPQAAQNPSAPTLSFTSLSTQSESDNAALASDETLVQDKLVQSKLAPSAPAPLDPIALLDHSDVYAAAALYQGQDQDDQAVQLYEARLRQGEEEGWSSIVMARYHKELADLYLVKYDLADAIESYEAAIRLDNWWPEARLGFAEALSLLGESDAALEQLETAVSIAPGSVEAQIALANELDQQGKRTEAMTIYINTAKKHPGSSQATLALARAWQDSARWDKAEESFQATIEANPGTADAYVGLAEIRMDTGAYDEAQSLLESATKIDYNNVSSYIHLGELAQRRGDTATALNWYQLAATLPAADQTLNLTLIDSLIRYGDYATALAYTDDALYQQPNDIELLLRRSRIERIKGEYDAALNTLSQAQANDPSNGRLYTELATLYLAQGQQHNALSAYQQAIDIQPDEVTLYIAASQLLAAQGKPAAAQELLQTGLRIVPEAELLYDTIAALQLRQGQHDAALTTLREGLDELGDNTQLFLAMGDYYINRANFEQVEERYNQALEAQPDIADVHIALGDLHLHRGEVTEAIERYQEAIRLDPTTPSHYLALGTAYETAEKWDAAEEAYRQALVVAPTLENGFISLANLYAKQERWAAARKVYEDGLTVAPASGQLLTGFAALNLALEKEDAALDMLQTAAKMAPTSSTFITRAAIYTKLGLLENAQADLESALTLEPAALEALVALGDLYKSQDNLVKAEDYYLRAAQAMPGVPTGFLRLATLAREAENRDAVVYWIDLARQAAPGDLTPPETAPEE